MSSPWWNSAVFYQIYPRSFADSNGDGVGDLAGITSKLDYLVSLGVDAVWLCPIARSPMVDAGYDISDPRDIDPLFGDLRLFDELVTAAHERNLRVVVDVVPNHTSDQHPWFQAALTARANSQQRARYHFRDGRGPDGSLPPNNWVSLFGGPAWTRITEPEGRPGQWYLHLFAPQQPDLNWENPEVLADFQETLRFWLRRGVDGFRVDVAHGMAKPPGLPDAERINTTVQFHDDSDPRVNDPGVHAIHRRLRRLSDEYPGTVLVGEIWVDDNTRFGEYVRPDELHLAFNFRLAQAEFTAESIRSAIENSLAAVRPVGAAATWTLSNHDVVREVTRYGGGVLGQARARAMALVELALPGAVFVYNGSELGLPEVMDIPAEALRDPIVARSSGAQIGRDGCRVPLPWSGDQAPFGFSSSDNTWLPMPDRWRDYTVERQDQQEDSMLALYRRAIALRRKMAVAEADIAWLPAPAGCLRFRGPGSVECWVNTGNEPIAVGSREMLLASAPTVSGDLPSNAAVWFAGS